ncbi:MAG TPA: SEC-C metal-binding domain-containing protein [Solirubrobacteraceae bacterium]|jgi:hypothetical protein|nr:SEC-C metal-binding domain-containing protein [Solirubrobacteraceae bacterium]
MSDPSRSSRENVERDARQYFPRQVEACEELLTYAAEMVEAEPWRGRPVRDSVLTDRLVAAEGARGLKTYRGSLDAALGGYGPQAAMLNRALFESMVSCWWACKNPELAAERFEQHQAHQRGLWRKRLAAVGESGIENVPSEDEQRELDKIFGPWGDRLWCGMPLHKLVKEVEDEWEQPEVLHGFFAIAHAANNETQHTSARSLLSGVIEETDNSFRLDAGPSLYGVQQSLHGALWSYGHILRAVATYFEVDGYDEIEVTRVRCEAAFMPLNALNVEQNPGRNDPCPCGSGKKFKKCHGA